MKDNLGKKFVGITNQPMLTKKAHGDPKDWWQMLFDKEDKAREWQKRMAEKDGFVDGEIGEGWRYGYTYTISEDSVETDP